MESFGKFLHPKNRRPIVGHRLGIGDTIQKGDVYDSTAGNWEQAPHVGFTFTERLDSVLWVRPIKLVA